jgi:hypothetical protein
MEAYLHKIVHRLARSRLVLSGYGKRPEMLWDSIRSSSHASRPGAGIFTRIRSRITNLKKRKNRKWVFSENDQHKLKMGGKNGYFRELWDGSDF